MKILLALIDTGQMFERVSFEANRLQVDAFKFHLVLLSDAFGKPML